ncbi:MAG TPA: hydrophobic protein [Dehalococcoidia bacterium]|jgi:hypothetical protein|nr:hydrophobic protein [Dehalococcoidia bacterium]
MLALLLLLLLLVLLFGGLGLFVAKWFLILFAVVLLISLVSGAFYGPRRGWW